MVKKLYGFAVGVNFYATSEAKAEEFKEEVLRQLREEKWAEGVASVEESGHVEELE